MTLQQLMRELTAEQRAALASAAETSVGYLYLLAGCHRRASAEMSLRLSRAAAWRVTPHDLRPDLYPHPHDGLPPERRSTFAEAA